MKKKIFLLSLLAFCSISCSNYEPLEGCSCFGDPILGHRMGILGCSTAEMKMSLGC